LEQRIQNGRQTRSTSTRIKARLTVSGASFLANDNIADALRPGDLEDLQKEVEQRAGALLASLVIDVPNDHNTRDTAKRIAKMFLREVFAGRYTARPKLTDFPNTKKLDELYTVGPIAVRSACSHHLCPIEGHLWVGVIPGERLIGLSKFSRLARWILARPQIQEEAAVALADEIEMAIKPKGVAVVLKAKHTCMTWRGVQEHETSMTTNVMRGIFREGPASRAEFFKAIAAQGFA